MSRSPTRAWNVAPWFSIPPEKLLRGMLLQAFYSIRSERQLMERLETDLLFRWFVGLGIDTVWVPSMFRKYRDRLLNGMAAAAGGTDLGSLSATIGALEKRQFLLHRASGGSPTTSSSAAVRRIRSRASAWP